MAYKRKTWKNDSSTPLNADGLNDFDKRVGDEFAVQEGRVKAYKEAGWEVIKIDSTTILSTTARYPNFTGVQKVNLPVSLDEYSVNLTFMWTVTSTPNYVITVKNKSDFSFRLGFPNGEVITGEVVVNISIIGK